MALVNCRECDREISKQAEVCPGCGAKQKSALAPPPGCLIIGGLLALVGLIGLSGAHGSRSASDAVPVTNNQQASLYKTSGAEATCEVGLMADPIEYTAFIKYAVHTGYTDDQISAANPEKNHRKLYMSIPNKEYYYDKVYSEVADSLKKIDQIRSENPNLELPDKCEKAIDFLNGEMSKGMQ